MALVNNNNNDIINNNNNNNDSNIDALFETCKQTIDNLRKAVIRAQVQKLEDNPTPLKTKYDGNDSNNNKINFRARKVLHGHFSKIYRSDWSLKGEIASVAQDEKIIIWNGTSGNKKSVISLNEAWRMAIRWAPSGNYLACGGLDNACTIYAFNEGHDPRKSMWKDKSVLLGHQGYVSDCNFINDNYIITSSGDSSIILWDIETNQIIRKYQGHDADVMRICTQSNISNSNENNGSNLVLSASIDATLKLWDIRENSKSQNGSGSVFTYYGHTGDINTCRWFPNANSFASGSDDSTVRLWDISSKRQMNIYHIAPFEDKNNKNNNNNNNSDNGDDNIANNSNPNTSIGAKPKTKYGKGAELGVMDIEFSHSGALLFAALDGGSFCTSWKTLSGNHYQHIIHIDRVSSINLSPNGNAFLTSCWDRFCRIWA